ncbi:MAG: protein-L-isoaspartate(D-aspartate) O-methyltransferase [Planctomycetota bacterium]
MTPSGLNPSVEKGQIMTTRLVHRLRLHTLICGGIAMLTIPACREPTVNKDGRRPTTRIATAPTEVSSAPTNRLPRTAERADERRQMVRRQIADRGIASERVLEAMQNVPRHWFVPEPYTDSAYRDCALPIGYAQTISQPYIVALMTEALALEHGDKVFEIGTGSGYQAAILAELTDKVFTIEIVEPLAKRTFGLLQERGYDTIRTRIGDGHLGWPEEAPFDAIIVTCAPEDPPPALVEQLTVGGRMCIPVGGQSFGQDLVLLTKRADGALDRKMLAPVRFVPMTGEAEAGSDP